MRLVNNIVPNASAMIWWVQCLSCVIKHCWLPIYPLMVGRGISQIKTFHLKTSPEKNNNKKEGK